MGVARHDMMVGAALTLGDAKRSPGPKLMGAGSDGVVHPGYPLGEAGRGRGAERHAVAVCAMVRCGRGAKCIADGARHVLGIVRHLSRALELVGGVGGG